MRKLNYWEVKKEPKYIPNDDKHNYPFSSLDPTSFEPTNHNFIEILNIFEPTNKIKKDYHDYKTLGTSIIST